jgi:glycosyltransferase involved in cell wall biosynthesis
LTAPLRIVHVLNHVRQTGNGIVNVVVDLACAQAEAGNQVLVLSVGGEYETLLAQCGVVHEKLDQRRNPANILAAVLRFRRIVRQYRPDVVHAHMVTGVVLAAVARVGLRYRLVATVHNVLDISSNLMGLADRVIAVSQAVSRSMRRRGIPARKLRVVLNGTRGNKRARLVDAAPPADLEHPAITTVAGMYKNKGIDVLIRAFTDVARESPAAHLYIVGDGPDRASFERKAARSTAASRIHFEGFVSDPQRYLSATDVFVLPSFRESFGLVLGEAREAGCAIVASRVDGIPEALDDGEAGILVAAGDHASLATCISELLRDPSLLQQWRLRAGRQLDRLNINRVCGETLSVYTEV